MKVTKAQSAENRAGIVDAAARLYREKGLAGVGVADITRNAGLTHGGLYRHFESKEALAREACLRAFDWTIAPLDALDALGTMEAAEHLEALDGQDQSQPSADQDATAGTSGTAANAALAASAASSDPSINVPLLRNLVHSYLSTQHRDHPGDGCPAAALAVDAARAGPALSEVFAQGVERNIQRFARVLTGGGRDATAEERARTMHMLSSMVGALVLARATAAGNPALSAEILDTLKDCLVPAQGEAPPSKAPSERGGPPASGSASSSAS
jgi:TetR/AcrR family transcriptional repressor of nem operon